MNCLEIKKIEEYIEKEAGKERRSRYGRVVILSDSKGNYLKTEQERVKVSNVEFVWWTKGGRNTRDGTEYLTRNIGTIRDGIKTLVIFWHLTCDITRKTGDFIYQRYIDTVDLVSNIKPYFDVLKEVHITEELIDIAILEAPPVFTKEWNKAKELPEWDLIDDSDLHNQTEEVNRLVREYNSELNYISPKFSCDFEHRRRNKKKGAGQTVTKVALNPVLLKDGVHPIGVVAYKWLLKVVSTFSELK